jgi:uncharacterized protein (DUF433 family)
MNTAPKTHIEISPGICGGKPRIAGTRIKVQDIVVWTELGESADEIVVGHPHLTLADVYAALTYYYDNQDRIDQDIRDSNAFVDAMEKQYGQKIIIPKARKNAADSDLVSS